MIFDFMKPKVKKSTTELFTELKEDRDIEGYLNRNQDEFMVPLNEYLTNLLKEKNLLKKDVVRESGLNREYAYHLFAGTKDKPSRQKVLAIGVAMGLNLEEMQYLLKYAKLNILYPRNQWDSVIISAIEQQLNVIETNDLLHQLGESLLLE
ncbi:MAG: DNA-binding protein [Selenomonadaceae bacterium]|nr:DNA-binding protein [Selenomonadaceae bacterium]